MIRFTTGLRLLMCGSLLAAAAAGAAAPAVAREQTPPQGAVGSPELLFDQGKRLFDAFQYDQAVPIFDRIVAALTAGGQVQKPELLVQTYELRGRARFALGDQPGTEQDFSALLAINPEFKLSAGISPRVVAVLEAVKKVTIGQVTVSATPPGEVLIDGKSYTIPADGQTISLTAGEHEFSALRPGYRPVTQKFTVTAATATPLAVTLERVSSTLTVVSIPAGAEVLLDGTSHGVTQRAVGPAEGSAPLQLNDIPTGSHRLEVRMACHRTVERTITIDQPGDLTTDPLRLDPTVASVKVQTKDANAMVYLDGAAKGLAPQEFNNLCEGPHFIEVRGPKGRFVDRRDWKTGDDLTLAANLRAAFPIVVAKGGAGVTPEQARSNVERALASAAGALVYVPADADLQAATRDLSLPQDWLAPAPVGADSTTPRVPREITRDLGQKLAAKLETQGVAAVYEGADAYTLTVALLAAGSSEPDVLSLNLADSASRTRVLDALGRALPALVRPSLETSVVDLAGVKGAAVVRAAGVGAKAGLALGDVIVGAGGAPIVSVADLRSKIAALRPSAAALALDVHGPAGESKKASVTVAFVPDTLPLRDPSILYNRALIDLRNDAQAAATPIEKASAHINLAIVQMHLGNWDDAQAELKQVVLPDGPGVSAGTVAYLSGLCFEASGHTPDAQAAFTKAAASPLAQLWLDGPRVAPLAQQKLRAR